MAAGPVELGEVAVTDAYGLDAEYVIHAAAMPHYGDGRATAESIGDATRNALEAADDRGAESLAIRALEDVRFVAYAADEYETVRAVAVELRDAA